jgi:hypothetical protein
MALPPYHFNCRTRTVMVDEDEKEELAFESENIPDGFIDDFGSLFSTQFWDKMGKKVPYLLDKQGEDSYFGQKKNRVVIGALDYYGRKKTEWEIRYSVVHEYGHAFHCNSKYMGKKLSFIHSVIDNCA